MSCEIHWNKLSLEEWEDYFSRTQRSNILQSYTYARAHCALNRQKARWGLITINQKPAGLVQILEAGILKNLFHAVILDRGPLWFEGFGGAAHVKMFFEEFDKQFPVRFGRKRRIIPEVENGLTADKILQQVGLAKNDNSKPYQTLWWDLTIDEETARAALKSNWRGALSKAEKADISIEWDSENKFLPWIIDIYQRDRQEKDYSGVSPKLLDKIAIFSSPDNPIIIGRAVHKNEPIAAILLIKHGRNATYQVGWSSEEGRKLAAHNLLLWKARNVLQDSGVKELDLGGINDETASGVKKFKCATGAQEIELIGQYY